MSRWPRIRRILKWAGTVLCVLLACLWLASGWYEVFWTQRLKGGKYELSLWVATGDIHASYRVYNERALSDLARRGVKVKSDCGIAPTRYRGYWLTYPYWRLQGSDVWDGTRTDNKVIWGYWKGMKLSIWIPLLLVAVPTAFLWLRDRRRIPFGHCPNCGCDLTGNVSGRCPECGIPLDGERVPR